jgi:hypothetical protein
VHRHHRLLPKPPVTSSPVTSAKTPTESTEAAPVPKPVTALQKYLDK